MTNEATARAEQAGREAGRQAAQADWIDVAARVGLVAFGVVHLIIGAMAVQLALGESEGSASSTGALKELAEQPFGTVLVWLVAIGMVLLTVWQGIEAVVGHRREQGTDRLKKRAVSGGRAAVYAVIAVSAVQVATGSSSGGGTDSMTATLMDAPGGQVLVGAVALGIAAVGGTLVYRGATDAFMKKLDGSQRSDVGTAYRWLGRAGYVAKGISLLVVATLFAYAAITHQANKSGGLDQALSEVRQQPFGPYLLIALGLGFCAYGLFCFAWSRHLDR